METAVVQADRVSPPQPRAGESSAPTSNVELSQKTAALKALTTQQLRAEWQQLYRSNSPRLSRDLLIRTLAYRLQELAYGGLRKATLRKLAMLTKDFETKGRIVSDPNPRIRPGSRLMREWRGRTHTIVVTEDGFEYAGKSYSSLSIIAQTITGAHWSGPRFFGLNRSEAAGAQSKFNVSEPVDEGETADD